MAWDTRAGARERLALLLHIGNSDPSDWIYDAVSDRWSNGTIGYKVDTEADQSLALLAKNGLPHSTAIALTSDDRP